MEAAKLMEIHGYEVPDTISKPTMRVLKKLRKHGILLFEHDDGPSTIVRKELETIAGNIGLHTMQTQYSLIIVDDAHKDYRKRCVKGADLKGIGKLIPQG